MIKNQFNNKNNSDDMNVDVNGSLIKYVMNEDYDDINMPNGFM